MKGWLLLMMASGILNHVSAAPVDWVDPFIGTGGDGHTTPAAAYPMGLVQAGPDTGIGDFQHCAGYKYEDARVRGFSQTHLSGTGCASLGDIRLVPLGSEKLSVEQVLKEGLVHDRASERATPGFYAVRLEGDVSVEATAAPHAALYRFTFDGQGVKRLVVDTQWGLVSEAWQAKHVLSSAVSLDGRTGLSGRIHAKHWVEREYGFTLVFDRPYAGMTELPRREGEQAPRYVFDFAMSPGETLMVKVGLSSGCGENSKGLNLPTRAKANLAAEIPAWDFDGVKAAARAAWNEVLTGTTVEGTDDERKAWYTALYHLYFQPSNIADVDAKPLYSTLSCWDTFRAAGPLYTILSPGRASTFVEAMLDQGNVTGSLPIWTLWGRDNQCMIGTHSVPMIVDAFLKGAWKGDAEAAFRQIKDSLTQKHANRRKEDWALYDTYGYYPYDIIRSESVSRTMECAYDDWCASLMAGKLGHAEDAAFFRKRAGYWKNVFDPSIQMMRGRDTKGNWREPFNPFALGTGGNDDNDFTEGNSYQYSWHVLHDAKTLIGMMGGNEKFVAKLDNLFELPSEAEGQGWEEDCTGFIGQYIHGNEPSHHVAYFYTQAGHPEKTAERVREVLDKFYAPRPDGLCGNDDCGQMSAWYLFSLMGFYPFDPCGGEYVIGAPQIKKITIRCTPTPDTYTFFTIIAKNLSRENKYVKSVTLNGKPVTDWKIRHADILRGGVLEFEMQAKPEGK